MTAMMMWDPKSEGRRANTKPIGWRTRVYPLYLGGMDHEIPPVFGEELVCWNPSISR